VRALEADDLAAVIAEYFQRLSKERERSVAAPGTLKRRMTEINKKTAKLADLLTKTTDSSGVTAANRIVGEGARRHWAQAGVDGIGKDRDEGVR
jgi:hypothetical protein